MLVDVLKRTRIAGALLVIASMWALVIVLDGGVHSSQGVCFQSRNAPDNPSVCQGLGLSDTVAIWVAPVVLIIGVCLWVFTPRWRVKALLGKGATKRREDLFQSLYYPAAQRLYAEQWNERQSNGTCRRRHQSPARCLLDAHWWAVAAAINRMKATDPVIRAYGVSHEVLDRHLASLAEWANLTPAHIEQGKAEWQAEIEQERARKQRSAEVSQRLDEYMKRQGESLF